MTDYRRIIIYLRQYEATDDTVGYIRVEKKDGYLYLSLSLTECTMPKDSPIYIVYREGDGTGHMRIGELTDGVTWEKKMLVAQLPMRDMTERIVGVLVGSEHHYLTGATHGKDALPKYDMLKEEKEPALQPQEERKEIEPRREKANLREVGEEMYPFEDDEMLWCRQIEPEDLSNLPMNHWALMGNSFLMQGHYNYRHLLCASNGEKIFIGVPGQYHRRELYIAKRFGFTTFKSTMKKRLAMGDFGYWLREI